jgi:hypothetical protein
MSDVAATNMSKDVSWDGVVVFEDPVEGGQVLVDVVDAFIAGFGLAEEDPARTAEGFGVVGMLGDEGKDGIDESALASDPFEWAFH